MLAQWRRLWQAPGGRPREWRGPWVVAGLLVAASVLRAARMIDDTTFGVILAAGVPLAPILFLTSPLATPRSPRQWLAVVGAALATWIASTVPGLDALLPGDPLAQAHVQAVGDTLDVPDGLKGRVRVLVHADLPARGEAVVAVRLTGMKEPLEARFERRSSHQRGPDGAKRYVAFSDPETKFFTAEIPAGARPLHVESFVGHAREMVRIEIYKPALEMAFVGAAGLSALVIVLFLGTRMPLRKHALAAAGVALGFGIAFGARATPASSVRDAGAALLTGGLLGACLGGVLARYIRPVRVRRSSPCR